MSGTAAPEAPRPDPRPLLGEPIGLDLLDTTWIDASGHHDLLEDPEGLRTWLHDCVLHLYDTSGRGDRRWCSTAGCGDRAEAARHCARNRPATT